MKKFLNHEAGMRMKPSLRTSILLGLALPALAMSAEADTTLTGRQRTMLERLIDLENSLPGISINGDVSYSGRYSDAQGSALAVDPSKVGDVDNQQSVEADLVFTARPTKHTRATIMLRGHQDLQNAYDEGPNPIRIHWWSYDGQLGENGFFNMGDMHVAYSPLTLGVTLPKIYGEAPLFSRMRQESMDYRHQDSTGRLLQGLNAGKSIQIGSIGELSLQSTIGRMRNQGKKSDLVFFDNSTVARYLAAARIGFESEMGVSLHGNAVSVMDRILNGRNYVEAGSSDSVVYDNGLTISGELGIDVAKMLNLNGIQFSLGGEFASASYQQEMDVAVYENDGTYTLVTGSWLSNGSPVGTNYAVPTYIKVYKTEEKSLLEGTAMVANAVLGYSNAGMDVQLKPAFIINDSAFANELAQSPAYLSTTRVMNANALMAGNAPMEYMGSSLESMYFTTFTVDPETKRNAPSATATPITDAQAFNNFIRQQYIRNAWTSTTLKSSELATARSYMDLAAGIALPEGLATANRQGPIVDLEGRVLDNAIGIQGRFAQLSEVSKTEASEVAFTDLGVGVDVQIGSLLGLKQSIVLVGGIEMSEDDSKYLRKFDRMSFGLESDIVAGFSFSAGYMSLVREETLNDFMVEGVEQDWGVVKSEETMLILGLGYKLATGADLNVNWGKMTNSVSSSVGTVDLDRDLLSALVKVQF